MKKFVCILLAFTVVFAFAGCKKELLSNETTDNTGNNTGATLPVATTQPETTTANPEDTTDEDVGSAIQGIVDTLQSKKFYLFGEMNFVSGQTMDMRMTCEGDNLRVEIESEQIPMTMFVIDNVPYIANSSTKKYAVIDEKAVNEITGLMSSIPGIDMSQLSGIDMSEMENMMGNFDDSMDFSQYLNSDDYSEFTETKDGVEYLCSLYKTEYGSLYIYTIDGELKMIEIYADGQKQLTMTDTQLIPQVLTPVTLDGFTLVASILNVFM